MANYWYTLFTKPRAEYRVLTAMKQRGIEAYLPQLQTSPGTWDPFFPCYLFVRMDLEQMAPQQWQWTPGLRSIVAFDGQPVPVQDQAIQLIQHKLAKMVAANSRPALPFQAGEVVRITKGPLRNVLAVFDKATTSSQRVQILLEFLGSSSRTRIDADSLEKVSRGTKVSEARPPRRTRGKGRRI